MHRSQSVAAAQKKWLKHPAKRAVIAYREKLSFTKGINSTAIASRIVSSFGSVRHQDSPTAPQNWQPIWIAIKSLPMVHTTMLIIPNRRTDWLYHSRMICEVKWSELNMNLNLMHSHSQSQWSLKCSRMEFLILPYTQTQSQSHTPTNTINCKPFQRVEIKLKWFSLQLEKLVSFANQFPAHLFHIKFNLSSDSEVSEFIGRVNG